MKGACPTPSPGVRARYVNPNVPAGHGSVELSIPTVTDDLVEGEEALPLLLEPLAWPPPPEPLVLTGTVIDAS